MDEYRRLRENYLGLALPDTIDVDFDTELVSNVILAPKRGKAPDIDGLTSEHILFGHPILPVIISKLFRLILNINSFLLALNAAIWSPSPNRKIHALKL